jgi:tetratricopeptide (TPR) repeat protein
MALDGHFTDKKLIGITYYLNGKIEKNSEKYENAINLFDKCLELIPDFNYAYIEKGLCLESLKSFEDAI